MAKKRRSGPSVWAAGFTPEFREWFTNGLARELGVRTMAFENGEDVLVSLTRAFEGGTPPSLLILALRLPTINGINVAIATRAFELGYSRREHVPIVFLFAPPDSNSFSKVVKFCQPLRVVTPGEGEASLRAAAMELVSETAGRDSFL